MPLFKILIHLIGVYHSQCFLCYGLYRDDHQVQLQKLGPIGNNLQHFNRNAVQFRLWRIPLYVRQSDCLTVGPSGDLLGTENN